MRLLALRGENLASLAGKFEIDFEAEPISGAGIFVVTGPTGAGKSTLLDAICLALFDRLPRLEDAEASGGVGQGSGGETVRYDDVRSVLRHGAACAVAEVDFLGQDCRRYRARWEVRRAHGRAGGKLQWQKVTLLDLEKGRAIGDKKTDTLQEIERLVGLNFDQFRRAVLLAQGEFDTFIKAKSKDRAELLERITGTAIYSDLSRAASARAKQAREALSLLEAQSDGIAPLAPDARTAADADLARLQSDVGRLRRERAELERAMQWYLTRADLAAGAATADAEAGANEAADAEAAPRREALARARLALGLRAEVVAMRDRATRLEQCLRQRHEAENSEIVAAQSHATAITARDAAAAARAEVAREFAAAGPDLDRAQSLDARIGDAAVVLARCETAEHEARRRSDTAAANAAALSHEVAELASRRVEVQTWLAGNRAAETVAQRLDAILADIAEAAERRTEADAAHAQGAKMAATVAAETTEAAQHAGVVDHIAPQLAAAEQTLIDLRRLIEAFDRASATMRRDALERTRLALATAKSALTTAEREKNGEAGCAKEASHQAALRIEATETLAWTRDALPGALARLEEAERSLSLSQAAGDEAVTHLRMLLRNGEPCPVCGATEHAPQAVDTLLDARLQQDKARVAELRDAQRDLLAQVASAQATHSAAEAAQARAEARRASHATEYAAAFARLAKAAASIRADSAVTTIELGDGPPGRVALDDADAQVETVLAETVAALATDAEIQARAQAVAASRDQLRHQLTCAEAAANEARLRARDAIAGVDQANRDGARAQGEADRLNARLDTVLGRSMPNWRGLRDLAGACRKLATLWRERHEAEANTGRVLDGKRPELATLQAEAAAFAATADAANAATLREREAIAQLREARGRVFDGRAVSDIRDLFESRVAQAEARLHAAETSRVTQEVELGACASATAAARRDVDRATQELTAAQQELHARLDAQGLSLAEAESAFNVGDDGLRAESDALDALGMVARHTRAVAVERAAALSRHVAVGTPALDEAATKERLTVLTAEESVAATALQQTAAALLHDDGLRRQARALRDKIAAQREKGRVWEQLDQLIGSADGGKFRRYAQSLTLDTLVALSNRHLSELHPRYELQRAPGGDMALQMIDRDMGHEVRGLHNLSGGEKFLVSLALALGLASMSSSEGVRVESLFIDEGFGALDPHSLGLAISVLERLQASGRQVGIISHVEEIKERISVKVQVTPTGSGRSQVMVFAS